MTNVFPSLPKAVIFDLDGTLIEDPGIFGQRGRKAKAMSYKELLEYTKDSERKPWLGVNEYLESWFRYSEKQPAKAHAKELIRFLHEHNIPVFVVSSGAQNCVRDAVKKAFGNDIDPNNIYGSYNNTPVKPNPNAYLFPLRAHGIDTSDVKDIMVVGDTASNDLEPAIQLGMKAVYLNDHGYTDSRIEALKARGDIHEVKSLNELHHMLKTAQKEQPPSHHAAAGETLLYHPEASRISHTDFITQGRQLNAASLLSGR